MQGFQRKGIPGINDLLDRNAADAPNMTFLQFGSSKHTYADVRAQVASTARGLASLGVEQGSRVAVLMENSIELVYTWLATAQLGGVFVPINTNFIGEYLRSHLDAARAEVVVVDQTHLPALAQATIHLDSLVHVVVNETESGFAKPHLAGKKLHLFSEVVAVAGDVTAVGNGGESIGDSGAIMFTSGTTGRSKGVVLTQHYLLRQAEQMWNSRLGASDDVVYTSFPLYHLNAMILCVLGPLIGCATGAIDQYFSLSRYWERVRKYEATQVNMMGSMMTMLWNVPPTSNDFNDRLRGCVAAPIPPALREPFEQRFGVRFVTIYGMSEATPLALSGLGDPPPPSGTSGLVNPLFDVRIFGDDDEELAPNETGQIVCRPREPDVMFAGYFDNDAATVEAWRNLWFHSGDLGRIDENGYLTFLGRIKDAIRRRGENISAFELEEAIQTFPGIAEVAVHAVPSEFGEDEVKACLVLGIGANVTYEEVMEFCIAQVPYFAVPRYLEFVTELPRNMSKRVVKGDLEKRGITPETWDREAAGIVVKRTRPTSS